ncbi:MAG: DUF6147 family protein [Clostridia bacterium]|nr:DUF6147 family protein [Clostridia bacterium]
MKKGLVFILVLVMVMGCASMVYGAQDSIIQAGNTMVTKAASSNSMIDLCGSLIQNLGNGDVYIQGYTQSFNKVDTIKVKVYLQKLTITGWTNVDSWTKTETNDDYAEKYLVENVETGYYYRVRSYHTVIDNGVTEYTDTMTDDILIY